MTFDMNTNEAGAPHPDENFEQPGGAPKGPGDNSASIAHLHRVITDAIVRGQRSGMESLTGFRDIGAALNEAKEIFPKGEFGPWAESEFKFSKEWRARLMRLDTAWSDVLASQAWAVRLGQVLGRKEYGVDGALALVKMWQAATNPEVQAEAEARKAEREAKAKEKAEGKAEDGDDLRRLLEEAMARIASLEAELAKAKGGSKSKAKADPGKAEDSAPADVKPGDKAKAAKVHGLYKRGGTEGERDAAKTRLEALAAKNGMTFEDFLAACGLDA